MSVQRKDVHQAEVYYPRLYLEKRPKRLVGFNANGLLPETESPDPDGIGKSSSSVGRNESYEGKARKGSRQKVIAPLGLY